MTIRQLLLDQYTGLSFKGGIKPLQSTTEGGRSWMAPSWVGDQHDRRLAAYKVLYSIFRNAGREFIQVVDEHDRDKHREYGDAALLVKVVLAAVMGDDIGIAVEGAEDDENAAAQERQDWFDAWADAERLPAKIMETERDAQKLGDGVYVFATSRDKGRIRVRLFDPGFYFPELDPNMAEDEFPRRVHIAWEFEDTRSGPTVVRKVRRMTFELGDLPEGERPRRYPWNDKPSTTTCYWTDGTWLLENLDGYNVENFPLSRAEAFAMTTTGQGASQAPVEVRQLDLGIDFLPVIHLPNTVEIKEHYGEALLTAVAQILEDLAWADSDAAEAAKLAGVPMLGAAGIAAADVKVKAGSVLGLGPTGSLSVVDLSPGLRACMEYVKSLRDRLNENVRVPAEVVGRVESQQDQSGIHLALSFGPMRSLVEEMRMVRNEKYPLFLKMVQRMSIAAGFLAGPVLPAQVKFGSFLPTDRAAVVDLVLNLWNAKLISRHRAIRLLVDEGIVDVDVVDELEAAEADDFTAALALLEATEGDLDAVYDALHRDRPEPQPAEPATNLAAPGAPPTINLPPRPPRNAAGSLGGAPAPADQGSPAGPPAQA